MPAVWWPWRWPICPKRANASVVRHWPTPSSPIVPPCPPPPNRSWGSSLRSTSCDQVARDVLRQCMAGDPPVELPRALLEEPCAQALFGILVEGLGDRFEPALCDIYARLFSHAIPGADLARYDRVRRSRPVALQPRRVLVLSRVTLGADVAVTSVLLDAAKQAFSHAEIVFAGPRKNFEMFAADPRLT